jgi:hypothetical protein
MLKLVVNILTTGPYRSRKFPLQLRDLVALISLCSSFLLCGIIICSSAYSTALTTVFHATSFLHWFHSHSSLYPHTSNCRHLLQNVPLFPCNERNCSVLHSVRTVLTRRYVTKYSNKLFWPHIETFSKYIRKKELHTHLTYWIQYIQFSPRQTRSPHFTRM